MMNFLILRNNLGSIFGPVGSGVQFFCRDPLIGVSSDATDRSNICGIYSCPSKFWILTPSCKYNGLIRELLKNHTHQNFVQHRHTSLTYKYEIKHLSYNITYLLLLSEDLLIFQILTIFT